MNLSDVLDIYKEALAAHAIFEAAGVLPDDIFVVPNAIDPKFGEAGHLGVMAKGHGRSFLVTVGLFEGDAARLRREWPGVVAAWNAASEVERVRVTERTRIRRSAVEILTAMAAKGFVARRRETHA